MAGSASNRLHLLNRSALPARLRFSSSRRLVWDSWLAPGGGIQVPDPRRCDVEACASFTDPGNHVTYTATASLSGNNGGLAARMCGIAGAWRFNLDAEDGDGRGLRLQNFTAAAVHFECRFSNSPFLAVVVLDAGSTARLDLGDTEVSVIIDGMTSASLPLREWQNDILIDTDDLNGRALPSLTVRARDGRRGHPDDPDMQRTKS